jgi:hypothetical protein
MPDLTETAAAAERSRAELRGNVAGAASAYARQIADTAEAELRLAQDPDRDDLSEAAREARKALDEVRAEFDRQVKAEKGKHTKRVNALVADLT